MFLNHRWHLTWGQRLLLSYQPTWQGVNPRYAVAFVLFILPEEVRPNIWMNGCCWYCRSKLLSWKSWGIDLVQSCWTGLTILLFSTDYNVSIWTELLVSAPSRHETWNSVALWFAGLMRVSRSVAFLNCWRNWNQRYCAAIGERTGEWQKDFWGELKMDCVLFTPSDHAVFAFISFPS